MPGAVFEARLVPLDEPGPGGGERAELWFSASPGQPARPIAKAASGGELSRVMLACRSVLADLDEIGTLVFDEVDAGIGGQAGLAVGRRLARLAGGRQVLVVTHLPQIACFADRHLRVAKDGGTASVDRLEGPARSEELSRMLAGLPAARARSPTPRSSSPRRIGSARDPHGSAGPAPSPEARSGLPSEPPRTAGTVRAGERIHWLPSCFASAPLAPVRRGAGLGSTAARRSSSAGSSPVTWP